MARGHLVPVDASVSTEEPPSDPDTPAAPPGKPAAAAKVDDWRAYAVSLGMSEEDAATATKKDCQEYVQVIEDAAEGQE
ncbi:hypothetical protein [Streptomyces sp. NPDC057552]|uniref:hypothetical protein n=1 Tax=Streptomyces sp. NPDC057552 TaxID=3350537 RepID=UPI0036BAEA26